MQPKCHNFSPEGVKSCFENTAYLKVFEHYCMQGYSIRYSSAMAVDCYQMFIKGHGAYSMLDSIAHPSRLHLIYEILPMALLIEKAGGKTSDTEKSVLDVKIVGYDQRINFVAGSSNDVDYIVKTLKQASWLLNIHNILFH